MDLLRVCPHYGINNIELVKPFWLALPSPLRRDVNNFYKDGKLVDCSGDILIEIFKECAEETQSWDI